MSKNVLYLHAYRLSADQKFSEKIFYTTNHSPNSLLKNRVR